MGDLNQNIRVRVDAVLNGMPVFQQFGAVLEKIKFHSNQKIQLGDSAAIANTNQLTTSIDKLTQAIDHLDEGKIGKVKTSLQSLLLVINTLAAIPGAFEGLKTLKNLATEIPSVASKIAGAGTAIHAFFTLARDKLADGATAVKTKVTGMLEEVPKLIPGLTGAAGGLATLGITAAGASVALGVVALAIAAIVAALVAIPAAATFLFNLANGAAEAGSQFHDLSQQTGASVELISALAPVAEDSNSSIEQLAIGLGRFNKLIGQAASGSKEATEDLKQFGLEPMEALNNQDAAIEKVFKRIIALPPGIQQVIAVQKAFGKSGAELLPTIIATGGNLGEVKKKAQELGVYWTGPGAAAADEFGDKLAEVKRIVTGLGLAVGQTLLPELLKLARVFAAELPRAGGAFSAVLQLVALHVWALTANVQVLIASLRWLQGQAGTSRAMGDGKSVGIDASGNFGDKSWRANLEAVRDEANTPSPDAGPGNQGLDFSGGGGGGGKKKKSNPDDTFEAIFGFNRAAADSAFNLLKDRFERQQNEIKERFEDRKLTIAEYYEQEYDLQKRSLDFEINKTAREIIAERELLAQKIAAIDKGLDPAERAAKISNETKNTETTIVGLNEKLVLLMRDRSDLAAKLAREQKAETDALNASLQQQINAIDSLRGLGPLVQARQQISEIDKLIEQFADNPGMVKFLEEWRDVVGAISQAEAAISRYQKAQELTEEKIASIQAIGGRNIITQFIAAEKIRRLRQQELKDLQEMLKTLEAIARVSNNTEVLVKIQQTKTKIEELKNQTRSFKDTVKDTFIDSLGSGLTNFVTSLGDIITGTKTLGQAFREMALSIIQDLQAIIAKMLIMLILKKLLGAFAGGGDFAGVEGAAGGIGGSAAGDYLPARPGGRLVWAAEGGHDEVILTTDPKHRRRTQNLLATFLQRTKLFEGFDLGGWISSIAQPQFEIPAFAAGGFISAPASAAGAPFHQTVQAIFPGVKDHRDFKLNQPAIERDLARAARNGVDRFRKG